MSLFIPSAIADNIAMSLGIAAGTLVLRFCAERAAMRGCDPAQARRRRFTVRAAANLVLALALLAVWMSEIQSVVLSLAAVMVALVVATKELIMCVAGSVLRLSGHLFKVGDRIELNGIHGEVIDHGLFSTTIMELPPLHLGHAGTGRVVNLPNSILLTGPVRVEAQPRHFAPHRFVVTLEHPVNPQAALAHCRAAAAETLHPDAERAARFHRLATGRSGTDIAGPGFEVTLRTSELGKMQFHVMCYCLAMEASRVEQSVTLAFLDRVLAPPAAVETASPLAAAAPMSVPVMTVGAAGDAVPTTAPVAESADEAPALDEPPVQAPALARAWAEIARQLREGPRAANAPSGKRPAA